MNYTSRILSAAILAIGISASSLNGERLEESSSISFTRNTSMAVTPDRERLCVVRNIISGADPRGGLMLVDLTTGEVSDPVFFEEEGLVAQVAASEDDDGTTLCFVTVTKNSGQTGTPGRNRVEVVRVTNDPLEPLVVEPSIIFENFQASAFGPLGIFSDPVKKRLYVADRGHFSVHVIDNDPASNSRFSVLDSVYTAGDTISVAVTPDGGRAYAANRSQNNVVCIDTSINEAGGPACNSSEPIPVSVGPSGSGTDIIISPDGTRAYTVFNLGQPCVSVIDVDPASATFDQEIAVIPTTGQRLESVSMNGDGSELFVVSGTTNELLVIDTILGRQTQRIPVGMRPTDVVSQPAESAVAYVSNPTSQTISSINPGKGVFLGPEDDVDERTDGRFDHQDIEDDCPDPSRPGEPDPGLDPRVVGIQIQVNCYVFFNPEDPSRFWKVLCWDPHPVTGRWQTCALLLPPSPPESSTLFSFAKGALFSLLEIEEVREHIFTVDGYDDGFRPTSAIVESLVKNTDGTTGSIMSSFRTRDDNGDGVMDGFEVDAADLVTLDMVDIELHDTDESGVKDHAGNGLSLVEKLLLFDSGDSFLPLADSNGDGVPDSPVLDFNRDGEADPEVPLFPFMSGPANPQSEDLWLYFAQFGDGGSGGPANLFSQILLLNLDSDSPAQVTLLLRDDEGDPLTVDLNGEEVVGEKSISIPAGGLKILETDGAGPLIVGSASVRSDRAVAGVIVFGGSAGLAGVGSSHVMRGGFLANMETNSAVELNTGLAVMNLEATEVTVELTLEDTNGSVLARGQLTLKGRGHRALFVDQIEWSEETGVELDFDSFRGLLRATADAKLAATVLQTRPGEFATLPVARTFIPGPSPGSSLLPAIQNDGSLKQKLYFPQFADGGVAGISTSSQILLFNLTDATANAKILIKDDVGDPLTVDLGGEVVVGEKEIQIPAGGLRILESDGEGDLTVGSVTVCSDQALAGVIVFAGDTGAAGVGASAPLLKKFLAPMESNDVNQVNTGIAVMNLDEEDVVLMISICDEQNRTLATAQLNLSGLGHRALFLNQFDWTPEDGVVLDFSDFRGILKVTTTKKVSAAVLQTRTGIFATQPVVPALN